jgi:hypothetical protein
VRYLCRLEELLPRRAEAFEAGLTGEGEDPLGDDIGLVQLVQVAARDGRGGPTEGESGGPIFGIGAAEGEVGAGAPVPVHRQTDGRLQVAELLTDRTRRSDLAWRSDNRCDGFPTPMIFPASSCGTDSQLPAPPSSAVEATVLSQLRSILRLRDV